VTRVAMIALMAGIFVFGVYPQPIFNALPSEGSALQTSSP
jgi:hypothetical protein